MGLILINAALAVAFATAGAMAYLSGTAAWDAGAMPLFFGFWAAFAGAGLWHRNIWLVSMAALSIIGLTLLVLFVSGLAKVQEGLTVSEKDVWALSGCLGLIVFAAGCEIYAMRQHRRSRRSEPRA